MSFPVVYQKDCMQCGIACIATICQYYGKKYSLDFLESICSSSTEGVSLKAVEETAQILGLDSHAGKTSIHVLKQLPLPCILHWNQNHFVVLYKINKRRDCFYVADPGNGLMKYSYEEFVRCWAGGSEINGDVKGIAMFVEPTEKFGSVTDDDSTKKRSFKFLFSYLNQYFGNFLSL